MGWRLMRRSWEHQGSQGDGPFRASHNLGQVPTVLMTTRESKHIRPHLYYADAIKPLRPA